MHAFWAAPLWLVFVIAGIVATGAYFVLTPTVESFYYDGISLAPVVAIAVGVRRNRPERNRVWILLACGLALVGGGNAYLTYHQLVFHTQPFPSAADALYLTGDVVLIGAIATLIGSRARRADRAAMIDSLIIALGVGILVWAFWMAQYAHNPTLSLSQKAISLAYPLIDVVLIASVARLALGSGERAMSLYLLGLSMLTVLVADVAFGLTELAGTYYPGCVVDAGFLARVRLVRGSRAAPLDARDLGARATRRRDFEPGPADLSGSRGARRSRGARHPVTHRRRDGRARAQRRVAGGLPARAVADVGADAAAQRSRGHTRARDGARADAAQGRRGPRRVARLPRGVRSGLRGDRGGRPRRQRQRHHRLVGVGRHGRRDRRRGTPRSGGAGSARAAQGTVGARARGLAVRKDGRDEAARRAAAGGARLRRRQPRGDRGPGAGRRHAGGHLHRPQRPTARGGGQGERPDASRPGCGRTGEHAAVRGPAPPPGRTAVHGADRALVGRDHDSRRGRCDHVPDPVGCPSARLRPRRPGRDQHARHRAPRRPAAHGVVPVRGARATRRLSAGAVAAALLRRLVAAVRERRQQPAPRPRHRRGS